MESVATGPLLCRIFSSFLFGIADTEFQAQFFDKTGARVAHDNRQFRQNEYGIFAQDSWKLRRSLTLNLGLRYQFNSVPYDVNGNLSNLYVDPSGPAPFTFELAGPNAKHLLYNNDFSGFEPRVGFAWSPFGAIRPRFAVPLACSTTESSATCSAMRGQPAISADLFCSGV